MTDTTKLPTPLEAANRVDEADGDTSGRGLDEVAALLRSMAQANNKGNPDDPQAQAQLETPLC